MEEGNKGKSRGSECNRARYPCDAMKTNNKKEKRERREKSLINKKSSFIFSSPRESMKRIAQR